MSSDRPVTLSDVQANAEPGSAHVDYGRSACTEDQEQEVLRTHDGQRVFDAADIFVLARLDEISVMLDTYCLEQRAMTTATPRNAMERHLREFGHALRFGCCYERVLAEYRDSKEQGTTRASSEGGES